jgi:YesN/AraC family two-component response regulator
MMPKMDGMEMIQQLKSSELTDHIPVIILTAKADRDSKLAGLEEGVDDYMIKPFDAEELRVRVNNLIQQRQKLRNRYRRDFLSDFKGPDIPAPEDKFLDRAVNCINKHITEFEFNVTQLGKELGLSRTQLYRKILALTDHTPNEFIRNTRLKMAARMFHEGHKNITRVVYSVGFNTPAYFTQCFREVYGVNPSEYIRKRELTKE